MNRISSPASIIALGFLVICPVVTYLFLRPSRSRSSALPCPPGPEDVKVMPSHNPWSKYREWGREYGEPVYIRDFNLLIINTREVAVDLLEKRSRIYSSRTVTQMMDLCGSNLNLALEQYSDKWRRDRRLFQQTFRQTTINRFYPTQYAKIHHFLRNLLISPDDFLKHNLVLSQDLVYSALYGVDLFPDNEALAEKVADVGHKFTDLVQKVGTYPTLERFPWLRFMPSWFPGCSFKQFACELRKLMEEVDTVPYELAVESLKSGQGTSLIAELAVKNEGDPPTIQAIKAMGTVSNLAASDTTSSAISSFFHAMILHPEVQTKAREEIENVIGRDRLPTFEDRPSLPYVEAIYREVMRLDPPLPLAVPHRSIEDDLYRGYHIPKGCTVVPNIWAMNQDPARYSEPDKFVPERFLEAEGGPFTSINDISAYGFGRRICVGRHMADNTVWLTIACVLATLSLEKAKDSNGKVIDISLEYTNNFTRHPKPYQCSIKPRSELARELILATALS